ncbi:MAG: YceI family protein [Pyrinomonadaceae bacterium]
MTAPNTSVTYRIDASKSSFYVKAFIGGLFSAFGHDHNIQVRDFTGEAVFSTEKPDQSSLWITIKAASLAVTDKVSASDRTQIEQTMRDEILETGKYPEITFRSTRVSANKINDSEYDVRIDGNLALHGVTRATTISARVTANGNDLQTRGSLPLRQTDFHIAPASVAVGTIKVKDELKLTFDIVAHK